MLGRSPIGFSKWTIPTSGSRAWRSFSCSAVCAKKQMPPRPKIDESEFTKTYIKGWGPGGQATNKTSNAVQLKHIETGIVVKNHSTRSRTQNLKIAMQILADKVDQLRNGDQSRAAIVQKVKSKRKASSARKSRRKYRKLEEEKEKAKERERENGKGMLGEESAGDGEDGDELEVEIEDDGEEDVAEDQGSLPTSASGKADNRD